MLHEYFLQQRLSQTQQFSVLVERSDNSSVIVQGYGRTAKHAADSIRRHAREYGYHDLICTSPAPEEEAAPDRGTGR